jgi:hypothetical protein
MLGFPVFLPEDDLTPWPMRSGAAAILPASAAPNEDTPSWGRPSPFPITLRDDDLFPWPLRNGAAVQNPVRWQRTMSVQYELSSTVTVKSDGQYMGSITAVSRESGGVDRYVNESYPAETEDEALVLTAAFGTIQSLYFLSDAAMELKANSPTAPDFTVNLKAGRPLEWTLSDGYFSCPFLANLTTFYVSCTDASRLQGRILTS